MSTANLKKASLTISGTKNSPFFRIFRKIDRKSKSHSNHGILKCVSMGPSTLEFGFKFFSKSLKIGISFKMSKNDNTADPGENSQDGSVAKKPENLPEIDKIKQTLKRKLDEITEKVQSLEESISKIPKIENDEKSTDRTDNKADSSKNSSSSNGSTVPKAIQKSEKRFVLKHVSKDVENLVEGKSYTCDMENHFSVDSCIVLQRSNDHLACFVKIHGPENGIKWAVETKLEFKVYGQNKKSKADTFDYRYEKNESYGFPKFLEWGEMKKEYLIDGSLTVEAHVQLIESSGFSKEKIRKFDESNKDDSDVILVVNKKEFYVLRKFLAAQSSFFKALLLGNFAESKKLKFFTANLLLIRIMSREFFF
ncbi:hypothetical protein L3Y34_019171 [Caenorhabditis briggsae]|uniref:BTB domain-containing protein n=2 Tax=Caenorhabditis briggsae TaxID=6238 RepID=A0AAE9DP72_CAEBR|nr:hypothetical protein L3Y34_019171 [Caenorhabditis briggsae]